MSHSTYAVRTDVYPNVYRPAQEDISAGDRVPDHNDAFSLSLAHALLVSSHPARHYGHLIERLKDHHIHLLICGDTQEAKHLAAKYHPIAMLVDCTEIAAHELSYSSMEQLLESHSHLRFIALIRVQQTVPGHVQEMLRNGWLYDFHTVPIDIQRLAHTLGHLRGLAQLESRYSSSIIEQKKGYGPLIGISPEMRNIYRAIKRISRVTAPVLITGESGTGKELIARTIHLQSDVRKGKFVAINCAAIPPNLIASELFGHEVGAYTGATRQKRGLIESADDGTLFLDEIGDMPLDLQPYLLRFLQEGTYTRVGGTTEYRSRARLITATNADLKAALAKGAFREDLYYRLNILTIEAPPLRQRKGDIPLLAEHYLQLCRKEYNRPKLMLSKKALMALEQYEWPGNVRELFSAISRAVVLAKGPVIHPEDLRLGTNWSPSQPATAQSLATARQEFDRKYILSRLKSNNHNILRTAKELDISRVALYRLMKRYGIFKGRGEDDYTA